MILQYLKGIVELGILYKRGGEDSLMTYSNSDYTEDIEDWKIIPGYVFLWSLSVVA